MDFNQYKKECHPEKHRKVYAWQTAIGLQKVDNLTPSKYLYQIAEKNIEENLPFEDAHKLINSYYEEKTSDNERTEEADKVSLRIAELISNNAFVFSTVEYLNIHRQLFDGIYEHAGQIRNFNISKSEWVLDGRCVSYGNAYSLKDLLEYDFKQEKEFSYKNISNKEFISHIAKFISNLWQIHIFAEGNTRTTAVFLIKYLNTKGFEINNDLFEKHSWYFRNALVRANYSNYLLGINETTQFLEMFLENLLFNGNHILSNKTIHVTYTIDTHTNISEDEKKILNAMKENPSITIEDCANIIKKSLRTTKELIKTLKSKNLIIRVGAKKNGFWKII